MDLWWLIDLWLDEAEKACAYYSHGDGEPSLTGARVAHIYQKCANQLMEFAGPRCVADSSSSSR